MDVDRAPEAGWNDVDRHPLIWPLIALIAGILHARTFDVALPIWLLLACIALSGWLVAARQRALHTSFAILLCGWYAVGGAAAQSHWRIFGSDELGTCALEMAQPIPVIAQVMSGIYVQRADDPWTAHAADASRFTVKVVQVREGRTWRGASGLAAVRVDGDLRNSLRPGDRIVLYAHLMQPPFPVNPGEFDRANYDRERRILAHLHVSSSAALRVLRTGSVWSIRRRLEALRVHARRLCERYIPPAQVPLATALLLGTREQLDRDMRRAFLETGTVHVLAISGMHLSMLVWMVWVLARTGWISRRVALWTAFAFVAPYAILTGAQPPVVRAAALAMCISGGRLLRRPAQAWNMLAASALAVLCLQPLALYQIGVQLSFLAVVTLGHCQQLGALPKTDPLDRLIEHSRGPFNRRLRQSSRAALRIWLTSLAVWIVSVPLVVYRFHVLSLIAVLLNPLLWAPTAVALVSGFGVLMLGDLLPPAAWLSGRMCGLALAWTERGIQCSNQLSGGHCWMPAPPLCMVLVFYLGATMWSAWPRLRPRRSIALGLAAGWFGLWMAWLGCQQWMLRQDSTLRLTFFSVGHGTCVLIELPHGKAMLYDCGRLGSPHHLADAAAHEIWSRGRFGIDAAMISHGDSDHFNALGPLLQRIPIREIMAPPHVIKADSPLLSLLKRESIRRKVLWQILHQGRGFPLDSPATIDVLHPPAEELPAPDNANSVVIYVQYARRGILLPGDLEGLGLARLLMSPPRECAVLLAPHHGSLHSSPLAMAAWARPRWIVISSKTRPHAQWLELQRHYDAVVFDTHRHHAIRCEIEKTGVARWSCWNGHRWEQRLVEPAAVPPGKR